jgi:hypothetical protein
LFDDAFDEETGGLGSVKIMDGLFLGDNNCA